MASPFKIFRKHQKVMLALMGVLVMVGFVILPVLMQGMGVQKRANPRVVETEAYGDLHESNLRSMRWRRQAAIRVFQTVGQTLVMAEASPMSVQMVLSQMAPFEAADLTSDEALVETWLLARRAEQLGFVVDEQVVQRFLETELAQNQIDDKGWTRILGAVGLSSRDLVAVLREELLAMRLKRAFNLGLQGTTPAQRWDYFQRLNRKVAIESLPVSVARFVDQVAAPDEAALRTFFNEHKNELYDPTSPDPGFLQPRRVAAEYLKVDYETFFAAEAKAVAPEEVKQYYEEHKEDYKRQTLPTLEDEVPPAEEPGADASEATTPDAMTPPAEPKQDGASPDAEKPSEDETSASAARSPFRFASFGEEIAKEKEEEEPSRPKEAEEPPPAKTKPEAAPKEPTPAKSEPAKSPEPDAKPEPESPKESPEKPGAEKPSAEPPAPKPKAPGEAPDASAGPSEPKSAEGKAATEAPEYLPLEDVEEEIRRQLARERAEAKIERVLSDLRNKLSHYHDQLIRYEVDRQTKQGGETLVPPEKPDLTKEAKEHELLVGPDQAAAFGKVQQTGLISQREAEELAIGGARVDGETPFFVSVSELPEHRPEVAQGAEGNRYLFWKVDEVEEKVPEFDEAGVRERVLRTWKEIEARDLAWEAARRLAEAARAINQTLAEFVADPSHKDLLAPLGSDVEVTQSEPFKWLDYGDIPAWMAQRPPSLGEVQGVEAAGNDFMRAVFDLEEGQTGTAANQPETAVYVVRVTETSPLRETLWHRFVNEPIWNYIRAADHDRAVAQEAWIAGIKAEVGFSWDPEYQAQAAGS